MSNTADVRREAATIISETLGDETASLYAQYYENKDIKEILISLEELLTEHMGEHKAKEIIEDLYTKYQAAN